MKKSALTAVGYTTAVMLIVVPLGEALAAVTPLNPGSSAWRFGAVGLFSRALLLALAGTVLCGYIALAAEHRRTLKTISILSGLASFVLLAVSAAFVLDAMETSSRANGVAQRAIQIASVSALVKLVAVGVVTALLARSAWKASRSIAPPQRRTKGVLVSQPTPATN